MLSDSGHPLASLLHPQYRLATPGWRLPPHHKLLIWPGRCRVFISCTVGQLHVGTHIYTFNMVILDANVTCPSCPGTWGESQLCPRKGSGLHFATVTATPYCHMSSPISSSWKDLSGNANASFLPLCTRHCLPDSLLLHKVFLSWGPPCPD